MRLIQLSFASRLVALVAALSVGATLMSSILLSWSNYRAMLAEAEVEGESVARLLAEAQASRVNFRSKSSKCFRST